MIYITNNRNHIIHIIHNTIPFIIKMRTVSDPELFRSNIKEKLNLLLNNDNHAKNLEKGIYNYSLKEATNRKIIKKWDNAFFVQIYTDRIRSIYLNLQNNKSLIEFLDNNEIKPHQIAFMTHQELNPEKWDKLIQIKMKRDKYKYETNLEAATDTFKCRKCHSNKCTYYQMQTRSADEPMTTFVTCINCGNRWKC